MNAHLTCCISSDDAAQEGDSSGKRVRHDCQASTSTVLACEISRTSLSSARKGKRALTDHRIVLEDPVHKRRSPVVRVRFTVDRPTRAGCTHTHAYLHTYTQQLYRRCNREQHPIAWLRIQVQQLKDSGIAMHRLPHIPAELLCATKSENVCVLYNAPTPE